MSCWSRSCFWKASRSALTCQSFSKVKLPGAELCESAQLIGERCADLLRQFCHASRLSAHFRDRLYVAAFASFKQALYEPTLREQIRGASHFAWSTGSRKRFQEPLLRITFPEPHIPIAPTSSNDVAVLQC